MATQPVVYSLRAIVHIRGNGYPASRPSFQSGDMDGVHGAQVPKCRQQAQACQTF